MESTLAPDTLASLNTTLLPVSEWLGVSVGLNSIIEHVKLKHSDTEVIFFQSIEIRSTLHQVARLSSLVTEQKYFVAGGALAGHRSAKSGGGIAAQTPWNTFAAWSFPRLLAIHGFSNVADEVTPPGMEEVGAIAEGAICNGDTSISLGVIFEFEEGVHWGSVSGSDRETKHLIKMASKESRARTVLSLALKRLSLSENTRDLSYGCDWIAERPA